MAKENQPAAPGDDRAADTERRGISNRESAAEEERERHEHPPLDTGPPPAEDAAGRIGDESELTRDGQTSHKAGSRSVAQKESEARYPDRSMPASHKVPGAFGKEPKR
jgi:hypothetical protein